MTTRLKTLSLMARYLILAALVITLLYSVSRVAGWLDGMSRSDGYSIHARGEF